MKLAVCLSGQPRDVKNSLENIKELWSCEQNVDFFFHSRWGVEGVPFRDDAPSDVYTDDLFDYIITTLNPVHYKIENPIQFEKQYPDSAHWGCYHPRFNRNPSQNIQSMFYSLNQCNNLKVEYEIKNNFKYDAVLKCRFDYIFNKKYDVKNFNLKYLNTKNDCKHTEYAINDHIALSNSDNMNMYSDVIHHLDKYYGMGVEFNPEVLLGFHVYHNQIPVAKTLGDNDESYVSTKNERSFMYSNG